MRNKDLQRLLSTFPDDLEVYEIGAVQRDPIRDVSERRSAGGEPYLVLETAPIPTETNERLRIGPDTHTIHIRPS